jgi:hypothetical protein
MDLAEADMEVRLVGGTVDRPGVGTEGDNQQAVMGPLLRVEVMAALL